MLLESRVGLLLVGSSAGVISLVGAGWLASEDSFAGGAVVGAILLAAVFSAGVDVLIG